MTAHDPRVTLTEVLAAHVRLPMMHSQGCTCGWHASLSHPDLHRAHLAERVEEHIAARLAPIRALVDAEPVCDLHGSEVANGCEECSVADGVRNYDRALRDALEATGADPRASQDHARHQPLTHCHCGRVIPCRHHDGTEGRDEECRPCCDAHPTQGCADVGCRHDCEGWIERFEERLRGLTE